MKPIQTLLPKSIPILLSLAVIPLAILGTLPDSHPILAAQPAAVKPVYPAHWGSPPSIQTRDYIQLPGGYGRGSSTLAGWISKNIEADLTSAQTSPAPSKPDRQPDGTGTVQISGELKQWHKVSLTLDGPFAHERDTTPNPFTDHRFAVIFTHASGSPSYRVPGYFAADGSAAESSAESGTQWRAHVSPDKPGLWNYRISFATGPLAALDSEATAAPAQAYNDRTGNFTIVPSDKTGRDFRSKGRLTYVGRRYLQFAGSGEFFLKVGPDAPETLLAYQDFDGTVAPKAGAPIKTWAPHAPDWHPGDPTWKDGKGKALIGALNYLASKGLNTFSFLSYNAGGDGDNVWPFVDRNSKLHYDCSKLDQWQIAFDHATTRGLHLHFKLQENEIDDNRRGDKGEQRTVPESLDGGLLGTERKLYCRELIARFAHELALNWNLGEENTQSTEEQLAMARYLRATDPYDHPIVLHTFPNQQDQVYTPLLGLENGLTGLSLQNGWDQAHQRTLQWVTESTASGKPWVVANDEQNPASLGVPPDPGYKGHDGIAHQADKHYDLHSIRKHTLWGTLMAGGGGVEYYFGYQLPENDLICQDFRSRDRSWDYCRIAIEFFARERIPFPEMTNANDLIENPSNSNTRYCLAKPDDVYLIYLPQGGTSRLDLSAARGRFRVGWFNPRSGGPVQISTVRGVLAGGIVEIGTPTSDPEQDWLAVIRKVN